MAAATARTRIILGLLLAFAASGLLLGALGLYGLVSHAVVRRTREVGLRVALGADRGSVVRMMVGRPAVFALAGAACGSVAAAWLTRYLEGLLFGTTASDPLILAGSAGTLVLVALLAALAPARRAARIEPAAALRVD
jgi:ABC-type antimicrobial peptide transport system permease subunit